MMYENLLIAVLGGGNLLLFIKFLIERRDKKKEKSEANEMGEIRKILSKLEKDGVRTQLLMLILLQPDDEGEILKVAEYYFVKLKADWYMTSMFSKWCDARDLKPSWFKNEEVT